MSTIIRSVADIPSQRGKLALITGGNRGLGYQVAEALAGSGAQLVLGCRDLARGEAAATRLREQHPEAQVQAMALDVADLGSIQSFAEAFRAHYDRLDLLIHNAAAILAPQGKTRDGFETHFGTNHLGPFALTGRLLDSLNAAPAARVVSLASLAHRMTQGLDPDDPGLQRRPYKDMDAYGRSKLATLLFTQELDRRLRQTGSRILAVAAHPGYTATNPDVGDFFMRLATRLFAQPPAMGALPILQAATGPDVRGNDLWGPAGFKELKGLPKRGDRSPQAQDATLAAGLWQLSSTLTGVRYLD